MHGHGRSVVVALLLLVSASPGLATPPAPIFPLLPHPLFDTPIRINGNFGDHRNTHFHAGLDLNTGGVVGRAVHAPIDGNVVRVRASGVGYGRSLYIETADGRLLVFGHLDSFAPAIAAYVYAVQDSAGQYEQDLWPPRERFRVKAGDIIGWTGRSGTGGPHLHVEIRRGDMAINPLLAGYTVVDTLPPRIERVTLAPLDDTSWAAVSTQPPPRSGLVAPATFDFGTRDTIQIWAHGRYRILVDALDAESDGTYDIEPWRTRVSLGKEWVECEFDSASWATDMAQSDFVYDCRRYTDRPAIARVFAAPARFRPVVIRTSTPFQTEAGVLSVPRGGGDQWLTIEAEDLAGHVARRTVRVSPGDRQPFWLPMPRIESRDRLRAVRDSATEFVTPFARVSIPAGAVFEPTEFGVQFDSLGEGHLAPMHTPLGAPITIALRVPRAWPKDRLCLHVLSMSYGRELIGSHYDSTTGMVSGSTRHVGNVTLSRDGVAPTIALQRMPHRAPKSAYPRWSVEAKLADERNGVEESGVDAKATYFTIDGHRVPSEWDSVINVLRWTPLRTPKRGRHRVVVVATDRVGNSRRTAGTFVID